YPHRATATYVCPNHLGGFLEMVLPLGLAFTLASRFKPVLKVFMGYAALAILAGIVVTLSRGTWVATALSLVVFFGVLLFQRGHRLASLALLVVIVGGAVVILPHSFAFQTRLRQIDVPTASNGDTRAELWQAAVKIWHENVWWGVGPAHYDYRFREFRPDAVQRRPAWAHNDILNTLTDWGVVGVFLVGAAWGLLAWGVVKCWSSVGGGANDLRGRRSSNKLAFVLGASAGLLAILAHSVCDFNMHIPANAILVVTLMALLSSHLRHATEQYWARAGVLARVAASLVLLGAVFYLAGQGWRRTREFVYLHRAEAAPNFSAARTALLKQAYAAEPMNPETPFAIGECYRIQSSEGGDNYRELATQAMDWYGRTIKLNRWDGYGYLRYGWCLDWLDRFAEADPYFNRADELDPNGYFTMANIGLHYVQLGDYAAARPWFERSLRLEWENNPIAASYLQIANARLEEAATNGMKETVEAPGR
ncbi:MAG TPA: O-antigen ligase family protein, partial [Candidatus Acidoferrum sp.]|nr:O-antigen ligase family protein [Candidatus Acidoferrum sp.]